MTFDRSGQIQQFQTVVQWPFSTITAEAPSAEGSPGSFPVEPDPTSAARYQIPAGAAQFNAAVIATLPQNIQSSAQENQQSRRILTNVTPGGSRWWCAWSAIGPAGCH